MKITILLSTALCIPVALCISVMASSCGNSPEKQEKDKNDSAAAHQAPAAVSMGDGQQIELPAPFATKSNVNFSDVLGWNDGRMPVAPAGFTVNKYVDGLKSPRWIYVMANGDVLVACANTEHGGIKKVRDVVVGVSKSENTSGSPNLIMHYHGLNSRGMPETSNIFLDKQNQPFGMLILGNYFYVANTDAVIRYPYQVGQTKITSEGKMIMSTPPGGYNNHWTRNIITNATGTKIYESVGSGSNVGEHGPANEERRANILEYNPDGSGERIYASGLRNPCGMGWAPGTNTLWTSVNERDELGDDLVPDYFTSVKDGGFYGWPYSYYGQHVEPRIPEKERRPDLVAKAIVPDVPLGSHTASLGLAFYTGSAFPAKYQGGAFIGQHGSWNRSVLAGYKVVFVPFKNGKPSGPPEDFLTGFVADLDKSKVYGRPVGLAVLQDGSMLLADDASGTIWRISANK